MAAKIVFGFTVMISIQMISGRCCIPACFSEISSPLTTEVLNQPRYIYNLDEIKPFNGGVFEVFSYSPIAPTGISVYSENTIQGRLSVAGILPFLGTVEVDGALPTCGRGNVQYSAGNGNVVMTREDSLRNC